jgi:dihydropteroate synthase
MAILNCTPDSFSDGGRFFEIDAALARAEALVETGAAILDVGGESTRPGAAEVTVDEELRRVLPLIEGVRQRYPELVISVDTSKAPVAEAALAAGADLVNDVSAAADPAMIGVVADHRAGIVLMHMRGTPRTMQTDTTYADVVSEVRDFLSHRAERAVAAGIPRNLVWLDPGIGFGKDADGNLALLAAVPELAELGHPVLVGPSRKSFIGHLTGAEVDDRLPGSLAALIPTVGLDRIVVRVHDPGPVLQFLEVAGRLREAAR